MLSLLAFLAHADSITLDTGVVVEGDLNRYEHGGDCEVRVTGGDLEGVILIAPCYRVQSFVRTDPRPVPVARVEPAVADAAPLPTPEVAPPAPEILAAPVASPAPPPMAPPPMAPASATAPVPIPPAYSSGMFGPAPETARMPTLEMPMAEPLPPPAVEELPLEEEEGSAVPEQGRPVRF